MAVFIGCVKAPCCPDTSYAVSIIIFSTIVWRALVSSLRQITAHAGYEGSVVVEKVKAGSGAYGFDANAEADVDMVAAGIIDPTKVARFALQNTASVASLMLKTEAMIAEKPKKKAPAAPALPPDMGDYDYKIVRNPASRIRNKAESGRTEPALP